jgi:hypothetical protein
MGVTEGRTYPRRISTMSRVRCWAVRALGSHPLARRSDRIEALVLGLATLLAVIAIPFAVNAGSAVHQGRLETIRVETQTRTPMVAKATADSTNRRGRPSPLGTVPVQWMAGSVTRDGTVGVGHPVRAGENVNIWVDREGNATSAPRDASDATVDAVAAATALWAVVVLLCAGLVASVRALLNRHRYRTWDADLRQLTH